MPRFFAQAQKQALAERKKSQDVGLPSAAMRGAKDANAQQQQGALSPTTLQGALAQMEVNAAAAMAKFKSFRTPAAAIKSPDKETSPAVSAPAEIELAETTVIDPATEAMEDYVDTATRASRLAKLEQAANRYLYDGGEPWHHKLRGTKLDFISSLMDRPLTLLALSCACLLAGNLDWLLPVLVRLLTLRSLSTVLGVICLILAISGWLLRAWAFMYAQMSAFTDTLPRMPQACEEMGEMLTEMKLMRVDLKSMKAKVAWLPGGE